MKINEIIMHNQYATFTHLREIDEVHNAYKLSKQLLKDP
jgi:hypothetical protein